MSASAWSESCVPLILLMPPVHHRYVYLNLDPTDDWRLRESATKFCSEFVHHVKERLEHCSSKVCAQSNVLAETLPHRMDSRSLQLQAVSWTVSLIPPSLDLIPTVLQSSSAKFTTRQGHTHRKNLQFLCSVRSCQPLHISRRPSLLQ